MNPDPFRWDLVADVDQALSFPFMVNAFRAGAIAAVLAGLTGWFMVFRRQSYAGHTLAVVGVPGAAGATLLGLPAYAGLFAFAGLGALLVARRPQALTEQPAVIGTVQAFALAAGFLFASLYGGFLGGLNTALFGSFLGITAGQVDLMLGLAVVVLMVLAVIGRPLLLASLDPAVAAARGVPVGLLSAGFLVLLGLSAAAAGTITGSLLVFALLVLPAATAANLTARPALGAALGVLALAVYTSGRTAAGNGGAGVGVLFGSIFGIGRGQAELTAGLALVLLVLLAVIARPLVFATVDEAVARARGVPVGVLGVLLLALTGAAAAQATTAVGALLLPGLLAAPAGAAHRLTARPHTGIALAATLSAVSTTIGLTLSDVFPSVPTSFAVIAVATAIFTLARCVPLGMLHRPPLVHP